MKYDRRRTRTVIEATEWDGYLAGECYVVVVFEEEFTGKPELTPDADMDQVVGGLVPLRFIADDFEEVYRTDGRSREEYQRAYMARRLLSEYGELDDCSGDCVPTEIAIRRDNRPIVAMYMFVYQRRGYEEIADRLDVKVDTVERYRRRV